MATQGQTRADKRSARSEARAEAQRKAAQAQRRRQLTIAVSVVLVAVIALTTVLIAINRQGDDRTPGQDIVADYSGIPATGMTLGQPDAPVTIVEYADFQCPYCTQFALTIEPQIIQDFVATGQVRYEFRPMPIISPLALDNSGNESVLAAQAAMCAADQGKFWDFHHLLYTKQTGENIGTFSSSNLITYAAEGGLDVTTFTQCMVNNTYQQQVIDSYNNAVSQGISSTPTLVINGTQVNLTSSGYDKLKTQIQQAIDGEPIED